MAIVDYSKQDEFDLVHSGQDCMGWTVVDQAGNEIGKVTEMLIETDQMHVDSIIVNSRKRVPAADIALRDGRVVVRGIYGGETDAQEETVQTTAAGGYAAYERDANAQHVAGVTRAATEGEVSIPIVEEQLAVGKRTVETGAARVRTVIEEAPVEEQVRLREEHVTVERRQVNRPVADAPNAFQEGTIEITERAEVPVVAKEAHVVEEVVVGKQVEERTETVRDTVRRTEVDVEEVNGENVNRENVNRRNG